MLLASVFLGDLRGRDIASGKEHRRKRQDGARFGRRRREAPHSSRGPLSDRLVSYRPPPHWAVALRLIFRESHLASRFVSCVVIPR